MTKKESEDLLNRMIDQSIEPLIIEQKKNKEKKEGSKDGQRRYNRQHQ